MGKINKLEMFYSLDDTQGIWVAVNFGTSIPSPTYQATLDFSHTPVVEASTSIREVDLMGFMAMLIVDEPKSPLASTKRDQDEG